ncbi:MAG: hypothetical protein ACRD2B_04325 [Terriglobia bacterium]
MSERLSLIASSAVGVCLVGILISCGGKSSQSSRSSPPGSTFNHLQGKTPLETARNIYENEGCKDCHTMTTQGAFGYTDRGMQLKKQGEGCVDLLTAMNIIAETPESQWTPDEKQKNQRFQTEGCTTCHQITPGKMGLTELGAKLQFVHMSCPNIEHVLTTQAESQPSP